MGKTTAVVLGFIVCLIAAYALVKRTRRERRHLSVSQIYARNALAFVFILGGAALVISDVVDWHVFDQKVPDTGRRRGQ